ncbi:hypothetical protein IT087_01270 [Candidatus Uhrbacteria bacterium]|nr:hypothetical protein [Candidatus Uhrbacteria bacterium]
MNVPHKPKINYETLQAFIANLFVATNVATPFVWNETAIKRALVTLMQENAVLRPFGPPMLSNPQVEGGPEDNRAPYHAIFTWFRGDCLDVVDGRRDTVKLNDTCLRVAQEGRPRLDEAVRAAITKLGPEFYRRSQFPA